jgi:two-component system C4-dicarboxylate transport sensor histidine kinase DctB
VSESLDPALQEQARLSELGLMVAGLGHELRQPLFAVKSIAQLLSHAPPGERDALLISLLEQVGHMEQLVEALGNYSRRPQGPSIVDVDGVLSQVCRWLGPRAARQGLSLHVVGGAARAGSIDPVALTQILVNLGNNAMDAAEGLVEFEAEYTGQDIRVRIHDDGPGLSVSSEEAFKPFVTTKPPGKGTGLGLSISRQLAQDSGGDLVLIPTEVGACFELVVPLWVPES